MHGNADAKSGECDDQIAKNDGKLEGGSPKAVTPENKLINFFHNPPSTHANILSPRKGYGFMSPASAKGNIPAASCNNIQINHANQSSAFEKGPSPLHFGYC